MMSSRLSLSNVKIKRSGRTILHIDNLQIPPGTFAGIIGTNGAGKTTLLKVCCGLIKPNQGSVEFDDTNLAVLGPWKRANLRKRIGYIPQAAEYNSELPFTLREVVAMGRISVRALLSPLRRQDYEYVDHWIDKLGLTNRRNQTFRSLSGGEQQKVLIARAMVQNPAILMLDEPGSNLDFNWKYQITDIIDDLYQQTNITILMVSHETNLLPRSCGRIVLLHQGKILADGPAEEVFASDALEIAYQCPVETVEVAGRKYTAIKSKV
ncbi:MAG: ABC transporter ATP-binding protein [Phycisphaerae bacterium]|nr:ABC transporter ATP-binding protein [Phycisphaerae bacterium]